VGWIIKLYSQLIVKSNFPFNPLLWRCSMTCKLNLILCGRFSEVGVSHLELISSRVDPLNADENHKILPFPFTVYCNNTVELDYSGPRLIRTWRDGHFWFRISKVHNSRGVLACKSPIQWTIRCKIHVRNIRGRINRGHINRGSLYQRFTIAESC
jgi:hypothetical protein